jgi:hypothetical protein
MRKLIKNISKQSQIDNIADATITGVNIDGTYDIQLESGAIKKRAINIVSGASFKIGDVVNISMVGGNKETAKILGRKTRSVRTRRTFIV